MVRNNVSKKLVRNEVGREVFYYIELLKCQRLFFIYKISSIVMLNYRIIRITWCDGLNVKSESPWRHMSGQAPTLSTSNCQIPLTEHSSCPHTTEFKTQTLDLKSN